MNGKVEAENGKGVCCGQLRPPVMRLPAAGVYLGGINRQTVARLIAEEELEPVYVGGTRMVTVASCDAYIERQRNKGRTAKQIQEAAA